MLQHNDGYVVALSTDAKKRGIKYTCLCFRCVN
nr:hypothetical protein [Rheinheimera pacifica]